MGGVLLLKWPFLVGVGGDLRKCLVLNEDIQKFTEQSSLLGPILTYFLEHLNAHIQELIVYMGRK